MRKQEPPPAMCAQCNRPLPTNRRNVTTPQGEVTVHITCSDDMVRRGEAAYIDPQQMAVRS